MVNLHKPHWLRKKIRLSVLSEMEALLETNDIHTVCQEALCPNIAECFSKKVATFMLMGTQCTRGCTFCAVDRGKPSALDEDEPFRVAQTVAKLGLRHVVITSVTRDDLDDGGAEHFVKTVQQIGSLNPSTVIELLIPDMHANDDSLEKIAHCGAHIIGHNLETVPRFYHIRKGSDYHRSLKVLQKLSTYNSACKTKSAIMLGLGEHDDEVESLMKDLLDVGCRLLSIGQYLSPSKEHEDVVEYVEPERFEYFRQTGMKMGFEYIKSSPYTRSSYMADEYWSDHETL